MAVIFSSILADVVVAVVTVFVLVYLYFANAYRYWKSRGIRYVEPTFPFGNISGVLLQKEHLGVYLKRVYDNNPGQSVVGLFNMKKPFVMVRDLDLARNVLVKDAHTFLDRPFEPSKRSSPLGSRSLFLLKSKQWRHMRMKLTPSFTSGKMKIMFQLINECGKQLVPCIQQEMSKGNCLVKDTIARYSLDVIASCAFGVNANALADPNSEFRTITRKMFEKSFMQKVSATIFRYAPWLAKLLGSGVVNDTVNNYIRKTFWDVADYRKKNKIVRKDFVDLLMKLKEEGQLRAEDASDLAEIMDDSKYMDTKHIKNDRTDIKLEDDDYVAQAFIFIAAGFETSSSVITFTLYELALNQAIQDKLRREIQTVLHKHNSQVTYDSIADMSYLEMVVSETMRKYPTIPTLDRKCLSDYKIQGTDVTIEKGTGVVIPLLAIHMDPALYPDPEKYDPERFSPENKSKRSNFAYMPFGEGPRICIGMRFGQMQVKTALVHLLTSFKVKPCADTPQPPLGMKAPYLVNIPEKDIVLAFEEI